MLDILGLHQPEAIARTVTWIHLTESPRQCKLKFGHSIHVSTGRSVCIKLFYSMGQFRRVDAWTIFVRNQKRKRQENTNKVIQWLKILKDSKYTHFVHTYTKVHTASARCHCQGQLSSGPGQSQRKARSIDFTIVGNRQTMRLTSTFKCFWFQRSYIVGVFCNGTMLILSPSINTNKHSLCGSFPTNSLSLFSRLMYICSLSVLSSLHARSSSKDACHEEKEEWDG